MAPALLCIPPAPPLFMTILILGKCATIPTGDDKSVAGANRAEELQADAVPFLDQLKSMPMTFHRLCLSVVETQRLVLEVQAIWAYFSTIQPWFTMLDGTSSMRKMDMDLVGCFTTNVQVTQQLHGAGVPVWVLRPLDDLVHTRIDKVTVITTVDGQVHLGPCPLHLCSVFMGSSAQEGKYKVFDQFTRSQFKAPNVFAWMSGQLQNNQAGCSRKGNLKPGPANRYEQFVDHGKKHYFVSMQRRLVYMCPQPHSLSPIRICHVTMQTSLYSPMKLSHQMWRTILSYDWVGKSEEHNQDGASVEPTWQGKSMTELTIDDVHEILWELSELGFRLEFLSLDMHLRLVEVHGGVVWKAFSRAPTLPCELKHIADVEADYPEHAQSLSKVPGYYLDITEWELLYKSHLVTDQMVL
ncbi:hypothetical protein F5146DRAFT_1002657 [Armillaria mellea]|nr:hypothetical protein F5146DRAFT_1002657 [Armillaria mellea]